MTTLLHPAGRASGKASSRPLGNPRRRFLSVCVPLVLVLGGTSAFGQQFLNVVPLGDDPTLDGWSIEVDHDLVRTAPQRLEIAAPDGRVLAVEMRVFEDRGDGNAMWTGGYPELGYESVVLTLQDGYLLGRFGLPEGGTYWIRSGGDGSGRLTEGRATGGNCGGGIVPEADPAFPAVEALRTDPPRRVVGASNHDRLDILMLYTASAAQRLDQAGWGTPAAFTQLAMDYLNLVLQNNQVDVSANMVHHQEAPAVLGQRTNPLRPLTSNQEVHDLRVEHQADLVHLFFNTDAGLCGQAYLMVRGNTAANFWHQGYGITSVEGGCVSAERLVPEDEYANQFETFAHEIGHNLGANHDRDNTGIDPNDAVYPYAFGHHNFTPQPNVKSVMSYNEGQQEPYFSTVRVRPGGWDLGVANERENERAVQQTVHIAVQFSDHLPEPGEPPPEPPPPLEPRPRAPSGLQVIATGNSSVKLTWTDESNNENGFEVQSRLQGARWQTAQRVPADTESADITGLRSGGRYDFRVRSYNRGGRGSSNVVTLVLPAVEYTNCEPSAAQITFEHGYTVSMCIEYQEGGVGPFLTKDAEDFELDSRESGLLYFFDRDNAEVLVKVLDACKVNGYRWVFVAPVTTLAFNLRVDEVDSDRPPWTHKNPRGGQTATTKSDIQAFPCEPPGSSTASQGDVGGILGVDLVDAGFPAVPVKPPVVVAQPISGGQGTDCVPQPVATLRGGYTVNMCVEYLDNDGETVVAEALDYDLDSQQSAILYFFDRNNAEVLIKVLDGCGINDHRWVFVAPVTTLAFNLTVESPDGEVWMHENSLNQTAAAESNTMAFACGS